MNFSKMTILLLVTLSIAVLGNWNGISATEVDDAQVDTEASVLSHPAKPAAEDLAPSAEDLETPVVDLEPSKVMAAGCQTQACGNTGTIWGVGPEGSPQCVNARADLHSKIGAAALNICPGIVTGLTYHYDNNCQNAGGGNCKESANADVECKICPGQFCW